MHSYSLIHVSDRALLRDLAALVARDRLTTAALLAHIAEVDARRLYVPAGYPSMHAYCVEELGLSEDAAYKRIQAARAARLFPRLFTAVAEGRLHLAGVCLLAPHLTAECVAELIEAAAHRRKAEIEELVARRFGPGGAPARMRPVPSMPAEPLQLAPGQVGSGLLEGAIPEPDPGHEGGGHSVAGLCDDQLAPGQVDGTHTEPAVRFLLRLTIAKSTQDKLRHAQALLSHAVPTGDIAQVIDRALDALIGKLETRKLGAATTRPRRHLTSVRNRHVPAQVRRAVWDRDQGQCTFTNASGKRCRARRFLEFDHVEPAARGGKATVEGIRLRCRVHNQYEAERVFGAEFMSRKRQEARFARVTARKRIAAEARELVEAEARARAQEQAQDVLAGLRNLGCRADEARRAAEVSATLLGATLEERMRAALTFIGGRSIQGRTPG